MNYKKWYSFLKEAKEEQKLAVASDETALVKTDTDDTTPQKDTFIDQIVTDDLSVFEIIVKIQIRKESEAQLTQIKDKVRAIISVTTVGSEDLADTSQLYILRNFKIKFALAKGENVDRYIHDVLARKLRLIQDLTIIHYGKVRKVR